MANKRNILISGGSGMIGREIINSLDSGKYEIAILTRKKSVSGIRSFQWNIEKGFIEEGAVDFADVLIHLAGENIAGGRWTHKRKKRILQSRVNSTNLLFSEFKKKNKVVNVLSASAIGYYGVETNSHIFREEDSPGSDYIADVVKRWENSVDQFSCLGGQVTKLRIGLVLSQQGGALKKLSLPIKFGLGSILGKGDQWMPWISVKDLAHMFIFLLEKDEIQKVYNAVAPEHIKHSDFIKKLAKSLSRALILPNISSFVLKILLGEMASILLMGSRISPARLESEGFIFSHPDLEKLFQSFKNTI